MKDKKKTRAQNIALFLYPIAKKCSVEGCETIGERHHLSYDLPKTIIWLCRKHHSLAHYTYKKCLSCDKRAHA